MRRKVQAYLTQDEEHALARRWRDLGDENAMHAIVMAHHRLASATARKYARTGHPFEELEAEALVGVMKAAHKFDPDNGARFSTYAVWWIEMQIRDYVHLNSSLVRPGQSNSQKALFHGLRRARINMTQELGREPKADELAAFFGVTVGDIERMTVISNGGDMSLDKPVHAAGDMDAGATLGDFMVSKETAPDEAAEIAIDVERFTKTMNAVLAKLPGRTRSIFTDRRLSDEPPTLDSLGLKWSVSKERIRQLENVALEAVTAAVRGKAHRQTVGA